MDVLHPSFRTGQRQKENKVLKGLQKVKEQRLRKDNCPNYPHQSLLTTASFINHKVPELKNIRVGSQNQLGNM